jgi:hypothetical protein
MRFPPPPRIKQPKAAFSGMAGMAGMAGYNLDMLGSELWQYFIQIRSIRGVRP